MLNKEQQQKSIVKVRELEYLFVDRRKRCGLIEIENN
jgi:hypothetical protein